VAEGGTVVDAQGELLVRAASGRDDSYLRLLGTYNRVSTRDSGSPLSPDDAKDHR
jgi:hypothetical protein